MLMGNTVLVICPIATA